MYQTELIQAVLVIDTFINQ